MLTVVRRLTSLMTTCCIDCFTEELQMQTNRDMDSIVQSRSDTHQRSSCHHHRRLLTSLPPPTINVHHLIQTTSFTIIFEPYRDFLVSRLKAMLLIRDFV